MKTSCPRIIRHLYIAGCMVLFLRVAAAPTFAAGGPGNALQFPIFGGARVTVTNEPSLNAYPLTVTAWIKTTASSFFGIPVPLVSKSVNEPGWQLSILTGGNIVAGYTPGFGNYVGTGTIGLTGTPVNDNQWHHVAFTVDASGGRLYRDGVLVASGNWVGTPGAVSNSFDVTLGRPVSGSVNPYEGLMDEVTIWNVALSQAQIQSNMSRSLTGAEAGLIAYYRCDESAGPTSFDSAPAGGTNHGVWTFVNATNSTLVPFTPFVETVAATSVGPTNATLNGVANAWGTNTSVWFEWGTTTNYGNVTAPQFIGSGTNVINFSQLVPGLSVGAAYHFRAVASNSLGQVFGTNLNFVCPIFTNIGAGFLGMERSTVSWADYDNDGRLDLVMAGYTISNVLTHIWRNTGNGFSNINAGVTGVHYCTGAWGDYDNDGRLDYLLTGFNGDTTVTIVRFLRNTGSGFTNITVGLPTGCFAIDWGDYDRDGRDDLLLGGGSFGGNASAVWRNLSGVSGNVAFSDANTSLPRVNGISSSVKWGDIDGDGWPDALVAGVSNSTNLTQLWHNRRGTFTNLNLSLPQLRNVSLAWGDYDNDGRSDLLLAGTTNSNSSGAISQIWRNTGNGLININAGLPGVSLGSVAWGDCDNDGRLDVLLCGTTNDSASGAISQIWRNTTNGFVNMNIGLPGIVAGSGAWGDFDSDGCLDIALVGEGVSGRLAQVWRNLFPITNTAPAAPTGLQAVVEGNSVVLKWNPATDGQTPSSGLTYNIRVGTAPGASDIVSTASAANGWRRLPQAGNAHQGLRWPAVNLPQDRVLYWSVQAVDNAFAGSPFATEQTFKLLYSPPALVPTDATSYLVGDTNGNGTLDPSELNQVLAGYFQSSPWLYLTNVAGLGGTTVSFSLTNDLAGAFSVEYTTNLTDWHDLGPATPRYLFTDTNAPALPQRYYRLRWP